MVARLPDELASLAQRTMTEREWQNEVLRLADLYGWTLTYHTHDSRRSDKGFPDLVLVHPAAGRVLWLELKTEKGKPTPEQTVWIAGLRAAGQHAHIVRPSDIDLVHDLLNTRGARRP